MAYTVIDIIEKMIIIEDKARSMYLSIAEGSSDNITLKLVAQALAKQEERHIVFYKGIKSSIDEEQIAEIDFTVYDRISSIIDNFKSMMSSPQTKNVKELINFALDFEKRNLALLIDIQGRLVRSIKDEHTITYKLISAMIEEEKSHISDIEKYSLK
jgi:bacterioferritin (cytochrome b1)